MTLSRLIVFILLCVAGQGLSQTYDPVTVTIEKGAGKPGETVCIDFTVEDFVDIGTFGFAISYNPNVIVPICPFDLSTSCLNAMDPPTFTSGDINCNANTDGLVRVTWFNAESQTLADNCLLLNVCFVLVGEVGDVSPIFLTSVFPTPLEFTHETSEGSFTADLIVIPGEIRIEACELTCLDTRCQVSPGNADGIITVSATGGTAPYDVVFNTVASGSILDGEEIVFDNLAVGSYTYTITDADGVMCTSTINLFESFDYPFTMETSGTDPNCFDKMTGRARIDLLSGGIPDYEIAWSNGLYQADSISRLFSGVYTVTVSDFFGCELIDTIDITIDTLKVFVEVISPPSCNGSEDGVIKVTATGGTPNASGHYEFKLDRLEGAPFFSDVTDMMATFTGLSNGTYEIEVEDFAAIPCRGDVITLVFDEGPNFEAEIYFDADPCSGDSSIVKIYATGPGNHFPDLRDSDGNQIVTGTLLDTIRTLDKLGPGTYTVRLTDNVDDCFLDTMFTILDVDPLEISANTSEPTCLGDDGSIEIQVAGGTGTFTYEWNIDANGGPDRNMLGGGLYVVTVTDMNSCTDSISVNFLDGDSIPLMTFVVTSLECGSGSTSDNGEVGASVSGAGTYTFTWSDGTSTIGMGNVISNLGAGIYFVTAEDSEGCTAIDSVELIAPTGDIEVNVTQTGPTCVTTNDGILSPIVTMGIEPFTFVWKHPATEVVLQEGQVFTGKVGDYLLCITDGAGCTLDTVLTMMDPPSTININVTSIGTVSCYDECDGGVTLEAFGGLDPMGSFGYRVNGVIVGNSAGPIILTDLCPGENFVIAFNGTCPSDTVFFIVPNQDEVGTDPNLNEVSNPICLGDSNGSITVDLVGVDPNDATINWVGQGTSGATLSDVPAGQYIVEISYGDGCTVMDTFLLEDPEELFLNIDPFGTNGVSCNDGNTGRIQLNVFGGNPGIYTYEWSPNVSTTNVASQLLPGVYAVTVTDSGGCSRDTTYELTSAPPVTATIPSPPSPACSGEQTCLVVTDAMGGVGNNYTFSINNGPRIALDTCVDLFAGEYLVTVYDSVGCSFDTMMIITQPEDLSVEVGPDQTINLGEFSGPISAQPVSFFPIDSFEWSPAVGLTFQTIDQQIAIASPERTTTYTVTVTDSNGCTATDDVTIEVVERRNVYRPNIFSPNGDQSNDNFQLVTGFGVQEVNFLKIYDRWGNNIYTELNYMPNDVTNPGWNGTYKGQELSPGVYVFIAEVVFDDGAVIKYSGDVTLVR